MPGSRYEGQIREVLAARQSNTAIDFNGEPFSWEQVRAVIAAVEEIIESSGLGPSDRVGLMGRNLPTHFSALWGIFLSGRCVSNIHAYQPSGTLVEELLTQRWPLVFGDQRDWTEEAIAAADSVGTVGYALMEDTNNPLRRVTGAVTPGRQAKWQHRGDTVIQLLSSGTTGVPKRIDLSRQAIDDMIETTIRHFEQAGPAAEATQIMPWPLSSLGGTNAALPSVALGQCLAIQEKFEASGMLGMIRKYKPAFLSMPPAALAVILQLHPAPEDFASVKLFASGAAPLDPSVRRTLVEQYGVPTAEYYGATEFAGIVTEWPMGNQKIFNDKAGSVGRALQGVQLRIVSSENGNPLPAGETGLVEALVPRVGDDWARTNDLGYLDEDGYLYIVGRADDTIVRGGMKVFPQEIVEVLRAHAKVRDAAVIGIPDERLGTVPAAAIETRLGHSSPAAEELRAFLRERLSAYKIPVRFAMVEEIPRTQSMKPQRQAMRALFGVS